MTKQKKLHIQAIYMLTNAWLNCRPNLAFGGQNLHGDYSGSVRLRDSQSIRH